MDKNETVIFAQKSFSMFVSATFSKHKENNLKGQIFADF